MMWFYSRRSSADSITCCKLLNPKPRFLANGSYSRYCFITSMRPVSFLVLIDSLKGLTWSINLMCCSLFKALDTGEFVSSSRCRCLVSGCSAKLGDLYCMKLPRCPVSLLTSTSAYNPERVSTAPYPLTLASKIKSASSIYASSARYSSIFCPYS